MKIKELPMEERPRERMLRHGIEKLSNGDLLAILLRTGIKEKSAIDIADELLAKQGDGMDFLAQCSPEELAAVKGVGMAKACQILSAIELGKRMASRPVSQRVTVDNPDAIAKLFMEEMRYYKKEVFLVLLINVKGQIITVDRASVGDLSSTVIHPREIFNMAVKRSAAAVILVHNHPSGNPLPSQDDMDTTSRLVEAGKILGINVLDHIVIGDGTYISFRKRQLIGD